MRRTLTRRGLVSGGLACTASLLWLGHGEAAVFRALSLASLVRASDHVALVRVLASECLRVEIGGARRIVTDTRVRVEGSLGRRAPDNDEMIVRTLGGVIGNRGERVDGEAQLPANEAAVLFLRSQSHALHAVVGMSQGHYPLRPDPRGTLRLRKSPHLPRLIRSRTAAATDDLDGLELQAARNRVLGVRP
jgi:hypothetical protein